MPRPSREILTHMPRLRRYAIVLTRDEGMAEDLLQEAFLRAHERQASLDRKRPLLGWLLSILHNAFIDGTRARNARERREADYAALLEPQASGMQEEALRLSQLRSAFFRLPDDQREALHLIAVEELSYVEAAALLHVPQGTLMARVSRARATLRAFEAGEKTNLRLIGGKDAG
ncbi:sigma-70 family RNA polymerase sigma factor [Falsirhodobacter xinxiangensis]|uniref:sigma-70 family RNA polymerase sigma factor n=1 Tax=Falsirhodobacter xinxiangensis TaxID=2530049 RepID=UPI0010AA7F4A|nr:sigma-70 family RNA polymerase sigma factor [Rhodobacter xinxiangensis]